MDYLKIAEAVRAARKAQGLTKKRLADAAGVSEKFLYRIEHADFEEIGLVRLNRVLIALNLTLTPETSLAPDGRQHLRRPGGQDP